MAAYPAFLPGCGAFGRLGGDRATGVGPAEWFGERAVEVINEVQQAVLQGRR